MKQLKSLLTTVLLLEMNLHLFDTAGNTTSSNTAGNDLSVEMKTYYSDYMIDLAKPMLIHDQFGQKHPIPKGRGKTVEFRQYTPLVKMLTPLVEGVTPVGQALNVSAITCTVKQYGGWIQLPDMLLLTAIDNNMVQATELLADQAGRTLDTITREELNGGSNVMIYNDSINSRLALTSSMKISVDIIKRAARALKSQNAKPYKGDYVAIIHPDVSYDLMSDSAWVDAHKYATPENIYSGEIGRIGGVRFVETTEAKIFHLEDVCTGIRTFTVKTANSTAATSVAVNEAISTAQATELANKKVNINGIERTISAATSGAAGSASLTLSTAITCAVNDIVGPAGAPIGGKDIYSTLVLGANAYGVTEVEGGGLEHITKQLGSAGSADPLNQRASAGWKATKAVKRLVEQYMIRIETCCTFNSGAN